MELPRKFLSDDALLIKLQAFESLSLQMLILT
jgi:hypothetical protein